MYVGLSTKKNTLNPFEPRQNFEHVHPEMGQKHLTNPGLSTQIPNFKSHELGLTPTLFPRGALFELILLTMNCGQDGLSSLENIKGNMDYNLQCTFTF